MSVSLRPAVFADLSAVTEVMLACWRESYAGLVPEDTIAALTPELVEQLWAKTLSTTDSGSALVAVSDTGTVLGATRFAREPQDRGVVHSLYVSPRAQRLGIGGKLLAAAIAGLRSQGATRLNLWVIASNTPSIAFYRSQGWTPDGATRVQPGFDVEELRLEYTGTPPAVDGSIRGGLGHGGVCIEDDVAPVAERGVADGARIPVQPRPVHKSAGAADEAPRSAILTATAQELVGAGRNAPAGVAIGLRAPGRELTGLAGLRTAGEAAAPMTLDTAHDLASITKVLATTTALIRLVSAGYVRLDEPIVRFLPGFSGGGKDSVTLRQLLTHRGGLWEWQPLYIRGRSTTDARRYVEELPLRYRPGTARHYSDLGFMLLGSVVEAASGMTLDAAVRRLVTEPLGLTDTRFAAPAGAQVAASAPGDVTEQRMVATGEPYPVLESGDGFGAWRRDTIIGEVNDGNAFHVFGGVSGHAGLFSTLGDLLSYAAALADYREHDTLWKPEVVEDFLSGGPDPEQALGFRRYSFSVDGNASTMYGHPGFVGCVVGFSPEAGVALAMCSNRLLTAATPAPTDTLWTRAREAAAEALATNDQSRGPR
ncbi:MAG: GNAT family N-acetyltransferase [Stackebrandtia sp.]